MDLNNFFTNRKTVRSYTSQDVDDQLLSQMLALSFNAPTTGGMQLYSVVVTRSAEGKRRLAPCHFNQPMVTQAPVVLTFCADFNRFITWCEARKAKHGFNNFESFVSAMLDAAIVAQQFNTIAEINGLGCCYLGTTTYNAKDIAIALDLPKYVIPIVTLTLGYPDDVALEAPKAERLNPSHLIHDEYYHCYNPSDIDMIYSEKENLEVNKRFVAENNKENLAQVFTDVRYPADASEHFSKLLYEFINTNGFPFP
ncbi:MAG: nitroreductase family protein [Muribaculaceae bacterium]|nr:nitroreductase family protein [Muribaculaceae bacterium]